jgi:hypothetical protein
MFKTKSVKTVLTPLAMTVALAAGGAMSSLAQTADKTPPNKAAQYKSEAEAKGHCAGDAVVWLNTSSKVYHFAGAKDYGKTKSGAYACEKEASASGFHAAKGEKRPS